MSIYRSFFAWVDGLDPWKKKAVTDRWYILCETMEAEKARGEWIAWCQEKMGFVPTEINTPDPIKISFAVALQQAHPKFQEWYAKAPEALKTAIRMRWASIEGHQDIAWHSVHGETARLAYLMQWCADEYGYDFTA